MGNEVVHPPLVDRVRIAVRERPLQDCDLHLAQVSLRTDEEKLVAFSPHAAEGLMYDYDYFYPTNTCQEDLFRTIGLEMVDVVMGGLSANCVVIGLADTGKTHTLFGSINETGLIQSTVRELFHRLEAQVSSHEYHVSLQYWEVKRDEVQDNLVEDEDDYPQGDHIPPKYSIFRDGFGRLYVTNLHEVAVSTFDEFEAVMNEGSKRRIARGFKRMARWHGFLQLSITTTDRAHGERCVLRQMTFAHTKGSDRVGQKGARGDLLRHSSQINVSSTLLCAGIIHSLEYRARRARTTRSREDLHELIRKSQSFFMECRFSQMMSQLICGHEASFVIGCVDPINYSETIGTLENLQLYRRLQCACIPVVTTSKKGRLLHKMRLLEAKIGDPDEVAALYADNSGRPLTEEEEELLRLRGKIEGWGDKNDAEETMRREEELKARSRARLREERASSALRGGHSSFNFATHGDRKKIFLNPRKTATYEGQWADGVFDGFGEHIQLNFRHRGEFRGGLREGEGTLYVRAPNSKGPHLRVYKGEWLAGKRDGRGTQWLANGEVYEGGFVEDRRHGHGKLYCVNGDIIEGSFRNGVCEGWAVLHAPGGDWFEGYWSLGMREGPGVWHYVSRQQIFRGQWSKNVAVMGTIEDAEEKEDNKCSGFIPRVSLVHYEQVLGRELDLLNERRTREFAAAGHTWVDYAAQVEPQTSVSAAASPHNELEEECDDVPYEEAEFAECDD